MNRALAARLNAQFPRNGWPPEAPVPSPWPTLGIAICASKLPSGNCMRNVANCPFFCRTSFELRRNERGATGFLATWLLSKVSQSRWCCRRDPLVSCPVWMAPAHSRNQSAPRPMKIRAEHLKTAPSYSELSQKRPNSRSLWGWKLRGAMFYNSSMPGDFRAEGRRVEILTSAIWFSPHARKHRETAFSNSGCCDSGHLAVMLLSRFQSPNGRRPAFPVAPIHNAAISNR